MDVIRFGESVVRIYSLIGSKQTLCNVALVPIGDPAMGLMAG
jgi:hypothetical protein